MRPFLPVAFAALGPLGALIASPPDGPKALEPNYTHDVAPLLAARCVSCHKEGGAAPFSLGSYGQAKKWSSMSLQVASSRRMPPWKPTEQGVFHDENRLTAGELSLLRLWDKAGDPRGPEVAPAAFLEAEVEAPTAVLRPGKPYVVMAGAAEEYRYFVLRNPFKETKWLRGIDLKPGNPRVVHHMTAFLDDSGGAERAACASHDGQEGYTARHGGRFAPKAILGFWAPGMRSRSLPDGTAMELPPGGSLVVQVHYVSTGKSEIDRWSLGLRFADGPPKRAMVTGLVERKSLDIPAGDAGYKVSHEETVPTDSTLWALMPHAHRLAQRMSAEAILPSGDHRPLIDIEDWDPAWQSLYWFKEAVRLPRGTRVRFTVTYDNSTANPRNPNQPPRLVHAGEASTDEMMLLGMLYTRD